jgi:SAM-dependent methyltransferase
VYYTSMAPVYDHIMLDGADGPYYDYAAITAQLAAAGGRAVLEAGCGTGLIMEHLLALRPGLDLTGVDLTAEMLDIARDRLRDQADLREADVTRLDLGRRFDLAYSYGGPWYAIPHQGGHLLISHICDDDANIAGLERIAAHLEPGGRLLLGVQAPHTDYDTRLTNGDVYSQRLLPRPDGFWKLYLLADKDGELLMDPMLLPYRVYEARDAARLFAAAGLRHVAWQRQDPAAKFLELAVV